MMSVKFELCLCVVSQSGRCVSLDFDSTFSSVAGAHNGEKKQLCLLNQIIALYIPWCPFALGCGSNSQLQFHEREGLGRG